MSLSLYIPLFGGSRVLRLGDVFTYYPTFVQERSNMLTDTEVIPVCEYYAAKLCSRFPKFEKGDLLGIGYIESRKLDNVSKLPLRVYYSMLKHIIKENNRPEVNVSNSHLDSVYNSSDSEYVELCEEAYMILDNALKKLRCHVDSKIKDSLHDIVKWRLEGKTVEEISDVVGVKRQTLGRLLRSVGKIIERERERRVKDAS